SAKLSDDTTIRIPAGLVNGHADIRIGVRPEKIRLSETSADGPSGHNRLTGVVRDASYIGVSTQYLVEARGGTLMVYEQNVERATRAELWARGDKVQLTWPPDHSSVVPSDDEAGAPTDPSQPAAVGGPAEPPT